MLLKKMHVRNMWYLSLMWFVLIFGFGAVFILFAFTLNQILDYRLMFIDPSRRYVMQPYEYLIAAAIVITYFIVLIIWRKSTFRRKDFVRLAESRGAKFIRKRFRYAPIDIIDVYAYADGLWDDAYVVARIDMPFFAYAPFPRISPHKPMENGRVVVSSGGWRPYFMKEESRVEIFSLINGSFNIDVTIEIDDEKRDIPTTGNAEMDGILIDALRDVNYFHARLIFNKDCLRLSIIGGSWEGREFGEKIINGWELFQKLDRNLRSKYPVMDWKKWQIKWNRKEEVFYLQPKNDH